MKNLKVNLGDGAIVTFTNKDGERVGLPLVKIGDTWKQVGVYLKWGTSKSDPAYAAVFPLPLGWNPSNKILSAIRKAKK